MKAYSVGCAAKRQVDLGASARSDGEAFRALWLTACAPRVAADYFNGLRLVPDAETGSSPGFFSLSFLRSACLPGPMRFGRACVSWLLLIPFQLESVCLAQVRAGGLGTRVNGSAYGSCQTGTCAVHGGTRAGNNLFHRLAKFDTRSGVKQVRIDTVGRGNVILGVVAPEGTFLNVPLTLSDSANLFLLSPGGLWLGQGGQFNKVPNLLLSTGVALDLPGGRFDAIHSNRSDLKVLGAEPTLRFDAVATPGGQGLVIGAPGGGALVIDRALLSLEGGLIIDAAAAPLALRQAHLRAGRALRLSGQGFSLQDSSLNVGEPGRRGPIDLHSNQEPVSGSFGSGLIERVQMSGNQININAGNLRILDSHISSPKGWVEVQTTNPAGHPSDLTLIGTQIDLNPAWAADAWSPQILRRLNSDGRTAESRNPLPHIGLFSRGNLQIERSVLDASLRLSSESQPAPERILATLPERAGVIVAEAARNLSLNASILRVDASHNLAGYLMMEAGKDLPGATSQGELRVRDSQLSTSYGAGGGVMALQADDGLAVVNSSLVAITDRWPLVAGSSQAVFYGGIVTLYNQSETTPLLISSSMVSANHHTASGLLSSPFLGSGTDAHGFGFFGSIKAWTSMISDALSGGYLQLYSKAGIRVEAGSLLDVSSFDSRSGQLDTIAGTIALINAGPASIELDSSRLEARNGLGSDRHTVNLKAGKMYFSGNGNIRIVDTQLDLFSVDPVGRKDHLDIPFLGISSDQDLSIDRSCLLVPRVKGDVAIKMYDRPVQNFETPRESLKRILSGTACKISERIRYEPLERPVEDISFAFDNFVDASRVIFEQAYTGAPAADLSWTRPLSASPPSALPPLKIPVQSQANVGSLSMAPAAKPDAAQQLVEGQQQALADTVASLGLSPESGRVRSVANLQQRLLRVQQPASSKPVTAKAAPEPSLPTNPYRPAIVQLGLSELPEDQLQIKVILLLAKGEPLSFSQTLPAERVKRSIRDFQRQLSRKEWIDPARGAGADLSRWLLAPLADALRASGVNALIIAADRGLQAIPYGALPFGDQPLAERYALSVSPSLGLLDLEATDAAIDGLLLAAGASRFQQSLAPLPMVPGELAALEAERAAMLMLDEQFTVDALQRLALQERFQQLHIATHAEFKPGRDDAAKLYTPRESMSLTALRNSLRARSPNRPLDLITLSACHTALGDEQSELGFVGMALQAGARSAVGSLWEVDDAATAAFFIQFYRYLYSGLEKDQALQATARAFLNGSVRLEGNQLVGPAVSTRGDTMLVRVDSSETQRRLSAGLHHPHFWAGMVLTGSPW